MVVTKGQWEKIGECRRNSCGDSFWGNQCSGDGCTTLNVPSATELYTLKWLKEYMFYNLRSTMQLTQSLYCKVIPKFLSPREILRLTNPL